jgi:hypothetical protein
MRVARLGLIAALAVAAGCGGAPPRTGRVRPLAPPELREQSELEVAMDRVRDIVVRARPGEPIRDAALEAWLASLVSRIRAATGRGQLPFEPGAPRSPANPSLSSTYTGREPVLSDGDLAARGTRLGSVSRALVLIDGDAHIGFVRDSIVIVTGRADVAFSDDSLVIAAGGLSVSHAGRPRDDAGIPDLLVSGTTLRISHASGAVLVAPDGTDASFETGSVIVGSLAMELLESPAIVRGASILRTGATVSPLERELVASVGDGPAPRACVHRAGAPAAIACAIEGEPLDGALSGLVVAWSSPRLVVLARGDERVRLLPVRTTREEPAHLALAPGTEVHVVGVYEPELPGGHVRVEVARRAPVVLVLMSHDAVTWDVVSGAGAEIVGVVVAGWDLSRVRGLPRGTPVATRMHALGERAFGAHEGSGAEWAAASAGIAEALGVAAFTRASFTGAEIAPATVEIR